MAEGNGSGATKHRWRKLARRLFGSPFFPLLFAGEAAKTLVMDGFAELFTNAEGPPEWKVIGMALLGLFAGPIWVYTTDDIEWGLPHEDNQE